MRFLCISGKARSGKDASGEFFRQALEERGYKVLVFHYADMLKWVCREIYDWDGDKNERGRWLLQYVGTDVVRRQDEDLWADTMARLLTALEWFSGWDYVVLPDTRYPNELDVLTRYGFAPIHIRVERPLCDRDLTAAQKAHSSETALDDCPPEYYIENIGTLEVLRCTVETVLEDILKTEGCI